MWFFQNFRWMQFSKNSAEWLKRTFKQLYKATREALGALLSSKNMNVHTGTLTTHLAKFPRKLSTEILSLQFSCNFLPKLQVSNSKLPWSTVFFSPYLAGFPPYFLWKKNEKTRHVWRFCFFLKFFWQKYAQQWRYEWQS